MVEGAGAQGEEVGVDMAIAVVLYLAALYTYENLKSL
jgi:hypothetical protein